MDRSKRKSKGSVLEGMSYNDLAVCQNAVHGIIESLSAPPSKLQQFKNNRILLDQKCYDIMEGKRPAYTIMDDDPMRNFKSVASRMHLTPMQVALVYFLKHVDAICATISAGNTTDPEPLEGRFADARNYIDILYHLWVTRDE